MGLLRTPQRSLTPPDQSGLLSAVTTRCLALSPTGPKIPTIGMVDLLSLREVDGAAVAPLS
jgi:hypothetical protein